MSISEILFYVGGVLVMGAVFVFIHYLIYGLGRVFFDRPFHFMESKITILVMITFLLGTFIFLIGALPAFPALP